jgi:selenide,water dikinase
MEAFAADVHTSGEGRNREWVGENLRAAGIDADREALLFDPQTSGGLLLGCPRTKAEKLEAAFAADAERLWRIGEVAGGEPAILVT